MPISFSEYVNIVSSVGGVAQASNRELMLRLYVTDELIPTNSVVEFSSLDEVGEYFGTSSESYSQASFYFGFISKLSTRPSSISFSRWAQLDATAMIIGASGDYKLDDFIPITNGALRIEFNGIVNEVVGLDFSIAVSLSEVASIIETQFSGFSEIGFQNCTVTYDSLGSRFLMTAGVSGNLTVRIHNNVLGIDIRPLLGWSQEEVRLSDGLDAQSLTDVLTSSTQLTNNYGSFSFIPETDLTEADNVEVAIWNDNENVKFIFLSKVLAANAQSYYDALNTYSGTALTLYDNVAYPNEYPWLAPGAVMAATPYDRRASVQNYMFQQFSLTALVSDTTLSKTYDDIRVNYYGSTQTAGVILSFYQRGFMIGLAADPIDMGIYANEVFLKDSIGVSILNLLLALSSVPANQSGQAQVVSAVQVNIDGALTNGIISVGKTLNETQVAFITSITGDSLAYLQIQNIGYWVDAEILEPTPNEFEISYVLLYSKNDSVRKVEGSHILI